MFVIDVQRFVRYAIHCSIFVRKSVEWLPIKKLWHLIKLKLYLHFWSVIPQVFFW